MKAALSEIVRISRKFGADPAYAIAGGGNSSWKDSDTLYVKASGAFLATIDLGGFVALDRRLLDSMSNRTYSLDPEIRERQVKSDLLRSRIYPELNQRPSVEASVHQVIPWSFVLHLHPTSINGLLCSARAEEMTKELFSDAVLFLPYITPGYVLYKAVEDALARFYKAHGNYPKVLFLQNHGVFAGADTATEIEEIYDRLNNKVLSGIPVSIPENPVAVDPELSGILPAIRALLSTVGRKILRVRNSELLQWFGTDPNRLASLAGPFTPDGIVYCNRRALVLHRTTDAESTIATFIDLLGQYRAEHEQDPRIILIPGTGVVAVGDNAKEAETALEVYEDVLRIAWYSQYFGGHRHMDQPDADFIVKWEVEAYRKSLLQAEAKGRACNRIAIVTGGAQGFGRGIVEGLLKEGACVILADINMEKAHETAAQLMNLSEGHRLTCIGVDVSQGMSVHSCMQQAVLAYGGVDLLVSNAGVLRAGGLDELEESEFDLLTKVNYKGFYLCARHFSIPMVLQHRYNHDLISDIVQINSKSGLQGSNKNFAYAGTKFGAIGLVQSFALELVSLGIKVNAICPGNYFEGPLWSDPDQGLFVQYLRAGKVPGAVDITDVKRYYESRVPMGRGCTPSDVMVAILYLMEQDYETGQALPVTGGQIMIH